MNAIAEHLWQSTWFAAAAWLLALFVRRDSAQVRYWVWFAASLKFLVPFAWLSWIGNQFVLQLEDRPSILPLVPEVATPFTGGAITIQYFSDGPKIAVLLIWAAGSALLMRRWIFEYLESCAHVKKSTACTFNSWLKVRASEHVPEPALLGILDPVVLLPKYAIDSLTPSQIDAILAHEKWHAQRHDNLVAAMHTCVQILFWFHPLVWWIGAKLVQEREHACDEGALRDGYDPAEYAESLIQVCTHSIASRQLCAARAAGGDLGARVRAIMSCQRPSSLTLMRRSVLAAVLLGCIAFQIALGMKVVVASDFKVPAGAHSIRLSNPTEQSLTILHEDFIYARNVSLREFISEVYSINGRGVRSDIRALDYPRYDIKLRAAQDGTSNHEQLAADLLRRQFNIELVTQTGLNASRVF